MRRHLTYANVVSSFALFLALGGVSYAAVALPKGSVGSAQIKAAAVTGAKIKNGQVAARDLAKGVRSSLAKAGTPGAPGGTGPQGPKGDKGDVGPATGPAGGDLTGTFPDPVIGAARVTAGKLADGAVVASKLGVISVVESAPVGVASGANVDATATCPAGTRLLSGGAQPVTYGVDLSTSRPVGSGNNPTAWLAQAKNNSGSPSSLKAFAVCLNAG
jgi:hypothetical protein